MKEIIAERDKSFFLIVAVVGLVSLAGCIVGLFYIPRFMWFYIFGISAMGLITLVGVVGACLPKWVIIWEENAVIIHNGFRGFKKQRFELTDIVGVKVQQPAQQTTAKQNGNIILTVEGENSSTKDITVINIKNVPAVVEKLNSLIQNRNEL